MLRQGVILLALTCVLAHISDVQAECCRASLTMTFQVLNGSCADVGGHRHDDRFCTITICADGRPREGTYCGQGSCNAFGCNCDNGCIEGNWKQSFIEINSDFKIIVLDEV